MKRLLILFLMCLSLLTIIFTLSGCASEANKLDRASSKTVVSSPSTPVYYSAAYDKKVLKEMGITLTSTKIVPKIDKIAVRKIAEDLLRQSSAQPKGIYLQYGLLTTANVGLGAVSPEAMEANPVLKKKKSISEIPVWVITMKGLLPDDYVPNGVGKGKQPLDISSTVIDAITGKVLFGFGKGK